MTDEFAQRRREVGAIVRPIQAATGRDWPAEQWTAWALALGDLTDDSIRAAVARWLQTRSSSWPMPADVRRLAMDHLHGRLPDADETFGALIKAVKTLGPDRPATAKSALHPMTWAVLEGCGGWQWACNINVENRQAYLGLWRKQHETVSVRWHERRMTSDHLLPAMARRDDVSRVLEAKPVKAIEHQPIEVPVPASTPTSDRYAERVAKQFDEVERKPVQQLEEQAAAVKADQQRKLAAHRRRKRA